MRSALIATELSSTTANQVRIVRYRSTGEDGPRSEICYFVGPSKSG